MKLFKIAVAAFAILPFMTAIADVAVGVSVWQNIGVELSETGFRDSVLDSQVRFLATIWFGFGVLLVVCLTDLQRYGGILRGAMLFIFLGGVARALSLVVLGMPESSLGKGFIAGAMFIEFVFPPMFLLWQERVMKAA